MRRFLMLLAVVAAIMVGITAPARATNPWNPPSFSLTCVTTSAGAVFTYSYEAYTATVGKKTYEFPSYSYTFTVPGIVCPF